MTGRSYLRWLCTLLLLPGLHGESPWSRFRGPNGTGVSDAANVPEQFGPDRNVAWKTPVPPGHSSPVLSRDRVYLTAFEGDRLLTISLDRTSGAIAWQREIARKRQDKLQKPNNAASSTPVTDGENVYAFFQDFGMVSYDKQGRERWRLPLGPFNISYGYGASPILVGDLLILPVDQDGGSYLAAIDKTSGKVKWKVDRPEVISGYSTPILYEPAGGAKQILIAESFQLSSYSPADGKRLWSVRGLACEMKSVPSISGNMLYINGWGFPENQPGKQILLEPFDAALKADADKDGLISPAEMPHERLKLPVYFKTFDTDQDGKLNRREWEVCRAMMASENGLLAIRLSRTGGEIRWKYQRPVPQVPATLLHGGALLMVNDSGILTSFDPETGAVLKQDRLKGAIDKYFASPVAAGGKAWLISQDGTVSVVSAKSQWEVLAVNALGEDVFATPAIANGSLYVRTTGHLYHFTAEPKPADR